MTASITDVRTALGRRADPFDAANYARFFQSHPGGYGEGDVFIGVRVPGVRAVAKEFADLPVEAIRDLLDDVEHEHRLAALILAVNAYRRALKPRTADPALRERLHTLYLDAALAGCVDNWDLVDTSAETLLGEHVRLAGAGTTLVEEFLADNDLWRRRIGIIATFAFIKAGDPDPTLAAAARILDDRRDLVQKAIGWMLREVGKRISQDVLVEFLQEYAGQMGRTALSYATEHLGPSLRTHLRTL